MWLCACVVEVVGKIIVSYGFLQLQGSLHGLQRGPPLHGGGLGDVLEDDSAPPPVLVLDELLGVFPLLVGVLLEVGGEPVVCNVISIKVRSLREFDGCK